MMDSYKRAMEEITLSPEADARIRRDLFCVQAVRQGRPAGKRTGRPMLRTAAILAAILLLGVTAYAAGAKIYMKISREREDQASVTFEETEKQEQPLTVIRDLLPEIGKEQSVYEAQYQFPREAQGAFVELGYWLPETIPAGYEETFVSDRAYDSQTILYGNEAGYEIRYKYTKPSGFGGVTMYGVVSEETVQIGENEGILFRKTVGSSLFWLREADGIGFWLSTDDPAVDLVEMARSVAACEPFRSEEADALTAEALAQLGDFCPEWLPEGFEEREYVGCPVPEDGWYGYVRRFYTDYATNRELCLDYEPFVLPPEAEGNDPEAYFVEIHTSEERPDVVTEAVSVNGMTGIIRVSPGANAVHWLDAERELSFSVSSSTVSVEELLQLAEGVCSAEYAP